MSARINDEAYFQQLRAKPLVAWPTVLLMLACHAAIGFAWYGVLTDRLPMWAGCVINCIALSGLFTPSPDRQTADRLYKGWSRAVDRARDWAEHE